MFHIFSTGVVYKRVTIFGGHSTHGALMIIHISLEGGSLMSFACENPCGLGCGGNSHHSQHQPQKYQNLQ